MKIIFIALYRKRPVFPIVLSLLLLLSISLTVIGATMLNSAYKQSARITDEYVTIAVNPDWRSFDPWEDEYDTEETIHLSLAHEAALNSGFVQMVDYRYILGAEVKGSKSIISCYKDVMDYDERFDDPCYNMAVFAVKVIECEYETVKSPNNQNEDENSSQVNLSNNMYYKAKAEIIDVISLADGYPDLYDDTDLIYAVLGDHDYESCKTTVPIPATIDLECNLFTPDGEVPFQVGHTYLIYGFYHDYPVDSIKTLSTMIRGRMLQQGRKIHFLDETRRDRLNGTAITVSEQTDIEALQNQMAEKMDKALQVKRGDMGDGRTYYYPADDMLPRWCEYSGSWEEFLASDEGRVWREEIIPLCKVNQSSATVILSNCVQSMYVFNTGIAGLQGGRFFNAADYDTGNKVCMISSAYAQYNGYKIGEKLVLDFYDTGFSISDMIPRGPCLPENRMNVSEEYEIIGIYSAPEFSRGEQLICADTILVPKKSVPGSDSFKSYPSHRLLTSLVLKNGTKDQFLAYMEQAGQKDAYLCFDQNFGAAEISLDALLQNGRQLLWIGLAAFLITAALAHFLTTRRFAPSAKTMRLLGIDRRVVAKQAFGAFLVIDLAAVLLGAGLAAALFSTIMEKAVSAALVPDFAVIAVCSATAFLLLAITSWICAKALSNVPLLQTEKKGWKQK